MATLRHSDPFEDDLGGLLFEVDGDADIAADVVAVSVTIPSPTITASGTPTPSVVSISVTIPAPTVDVPGSTIVEPDAVAISAAPQAPTITASGTPTPSVVPIAVTIPSPSVSAAIAVTPSVVAISVTIYSSFPIADLEVDMMVTESSVTPERVGLTVQEASTSQTVATGVSSLSAGAGTVLTDDYAFRALVSFDTTAAVPGDFTVDARGYVTVGSWGDAALKIRRYAADVYEIRGEFVTAAAASTWVQGFFNVSIEHPLTLGLGMTRDSATGLIQLWKSTDAWFSWFEIPRSAHSTTAGALPDSVGETLALLSGDFTDGPWLAIYQAQWAETDDINDMDADEVAAWNYGPNIVTGLGGDFYDWFDRAAKATYEFGQETSYVYKLRSQVTSGGRTIRVDMTSNAPTLNTGTPTAGTEAAFVLDYDQLLEDGPADVAYSPTIQFASISQFAVTGLEDSFTSPDDGLDERYRVILVEQDGTPIGGLTNAVLAEITWVLNEPETFVFTLPTLDPFVADIRAPDQEVQVWRGTRLLVWGVVVRTSANDETVEYQCRGLGWYFTRRIIGKPETNYVTNGSFEFGTYGWFDAQYAPSEPSGNRDHANWDSVVDSSLALTGSKSLRQWSTDDMVFGIQAISFFFSEIDPTSNPEGILWTAVAWAYIPSVDFTERVCAYDWNGDSGPAGMTLRRMSTTEFGTLDEDENPIPEAVGLPKVYEASHVGLSNDTPRDQWVRLETSLVQPISDEARTDWIQLTVETPIGTVWWDEVSITRNEQLFFNDIDQVLIAEGIVQHAQDPAFGKSDLNIDTYCEPSGITRTRTYEFFNHDYVADALDEFTELWHGFDWSIQCSGTSRAFVTHYPMKGVRRPAQALLLGRNIADVTILSDGEAVSNTVVMMADNSGSGSGREEAYASNTAGFASGLVLETALNAAKESGITTLQDQADAAMRKLRTPVLIPQLTTYRGMGANLLAELVVGDVVPVNVTLGSIELIGDYRIISIKIHPDSETMQLTLNPFDEWNDPYQGWEP